VRKEGFHRVSDPQIHSLEMEPGHPIQFKAAFEIMPDIQLGSYREMKLEVPEVAVTDEDVEAELKRLQDRQSSFDPVEEDRGAQDKDFVQVSFRAAPKEAAATEGEGAQPTEAAKQPDMNEILVEIGRADDPPEFSENLRGAKPGDERTFDVSYPEDHADRRLAGKTLVYTVKVNAIKKKITPELTDEFAKELGQDIQSLDDLKQRLRTGILSERQYRVGQQARNTLLTQLAESHDFPIPETLIQRQINLRLEQWLRGLAAQGFSTEAMKRLDFKRMRQAHRESATKEVKAELLLGKIADAENLQVTDEEIAGEVSSLAQQTNESPEALLHRLEEGGGLDRLRNRMRSDKAFRFIYDQSVKNAHNGAPTPSRETPPRAGDPGAVQE
jgi:trigger factor